MASDKGLDSELESFRQEWISEVRTKKGPRPSAEPSSSTEQISPREPIARRRPASPSNVTRAAPAVELEEQDGFSHTRSLEKSSLEPFESAADGSVVSPHGGRELISALDHFEEAMAKEAEGNLGDSLKLYRRAYRLDSRVDRRYREKHFPTSHRPQTHPPAKSPPPPPPPPPPPTSPNDKNPGPDADSVSIAPLPVNELIANFSSLQIQPAPAEIEGTPPPPCPISALPRELLVHILHEVALHDVGDFVRLSLVCKSLAYLVATEQNTWRHVCLDNKFGFTGMHYRWSKTTDWADLPPEQCLADGTFSSSGQVATQRAEDRSMAVSKALVPGAYRSWKHMFRWRPRIRFNGCYISTVNYVRMGQASTNQATWGGSPVHIVTYYRYLRFFRDGTAISLLTTSEPSAVVPHLTRELLHLHRDNAHAYLPSAVMQKAYRGRWRLSSCSAWDDGTPSRAEGGVAEEPEPVQEGDLTVETETHDPKYMFRMELSLGTAGKGAKNNKIVWRSHFSYNKLTDDWAEFTLKHDKPFFFSRVKSYGMGELASSSS